MKPFFAPKIISLPHLLSIFFFYGKEDEEEEEEYEENKIWFKLAKNNNSDY